MILANASLLGRLALTLMFSAIGGGLFTLAGVPAGWLSGGAVAVAIAALSGVRVVMPSAVRQVAFLLIGIGMGSSVSPDTLDRLGAWPMSILFVVVSSGFVTLAAYQVLHRVGGWDRVTAVYGAVPGALSYVMAVAASSPADLRRVALSQSIRLLFLVAVLPPLIGIFGHSLEPSAVADVHVEAGFVDLAVLFGGGAALGYLFMRLGQPAGMLLGPLLLSAVLHASGIVTTWLPSWLLIPGFLVLGGLIGSRFAGIDRSLFVKIVGASVAALAAGLAVSLVAALLLMEITGLPAGQVILAISPGALESMTTLAYLLGFDTAYVAGLHFVRFLVITAALPVLASRLKSTPR
ncbi:AbrB family transcriptional regulator [Amorphus suaedae]